MASLAVVVQRYGEEVVGGAERLARLLAEKLAGRHQITVLTTCARDYRTWANVFPAGEQTVRGVRLLRWPVKRKRRWKYFGWESQRLFSSSHSLLAEYEWIVDQGPECPGLIEYIRGKRDDFDLFLFFTYLYYPTFFGLPAVADKSVLVPTAHDEPPIRLPIFSSLFHLPRFFVFNTEEERDLVHRLFHNCYIPHRVIGIGVDLQTISNQDDGYLLYAGRVEKGKSSDELFDFAVKAGVPLKVIGQAQVKIPRAVEYLGFVDEERKQKLFAKCRALVVPSRNESLSIAVLEAWSHGKPAIVSAHSPVLSGHVQKSGGGYAYANFEEFQDVVKNIDSSRGLAGRRYVQENYSWDVVLRKYEEAFSFLMQRRSDAETRRE